MALEYEKHFPKGPLSNYVGKMWEELTYHGFKDNLPKIMNSTEIKCMWVFSGVNFVQNKDLLSELGIDVAGATEIDHLICCLTKTNKLLLIPIEVKGTNSDITSKTETKAKEQCHRNSYGLKQIVQQVVPTLQADDLEASVKPCIFFCHDKSNSQNSAGANTSQQNDISSAKIFHLYKDQYDQFAYNAQDNKNGQNIFSEILKMASENQLADCHPITYERLVCLLATLLSCQYKNKKKHNKKTCLKHFRVGEKEVCMKGPMLCPKYIHEYVVKNIDFLKYLHTFFIKDGDISADKFSAYSVTKLDRIREKYANKFFINLTNEQMLVLRSDEKRVVLIGDFGGGKTMMLLLKAMETLEKLIDGSKTGCIYFVSHRNALEIDVKPKFKLAFKQETLDQHVTFCSWDEFPDTNQLPSNVFWFLDEYGRDDMMPVSEKPRNVVKVLSADTNIPLIWAVITNCLESKIKSPASDFIDTNKLIWFKAVYPELNQYKCYELTWQLRSSHSVCFTKCLDDEHYDTLSSPVYGARPRLIYHNHTSDPAAYIRLLCDEVKYWLSQIKTGSILIIGHHENYELVMKLKERLKSQFGVDFRDLKESPETTEANSENVSGYIYSPSTDTSFSWKEEMFSGLEFDVVITMTDFLFDYDLWDRISRAKYGISLLGNREEVENCSLPELEKKYLDHRVEKFRTWGRGFVVQEQFL